MSSPLENFIHENRPAFDAEAPDARVWEKISGRMDPEESKKQSVVRSFPIRRWLSVAAAVLVLGLISILYFSRSVKVSQTSIADTKPGKIEPSAHPAPAAKIIDSPASVVKVEQDHPEKSIPAEQQPDPANPEENKEMYYYAKLIELKHEELKTLEKDEPLLYRQFSGDVQKLDSVYHSLKTQLPNNSNREQVIEAMISNLQLQIGLLNKQLDIIKQIKHSKKSAYEKAYKSV
jgi:hypothetical protein